MMKAYDFIPGVPMAGHMVGGFWHPGPKTNCHKCLQQEKLRKKLQARRVLNTKMPPSR